MLLRDGTFYLVPEEVVKVKESPKKYGDEWNVDIKVLQKYTTLSHISHNLFEFCFLYGKW